MSNIGSLDESLKNFDWSLAEKELGYKNGDVINLGWYCSDRICQNGKGENIALYYEGFGAVEKNLLSMISVLQAIRLEHFF